MLYAGLAAVLVTDSGTDWPLALFWTGARFALDSISVGEHSFTEWGIQYWPVKLSIPIGAALIVLQGASKLVKDIIFITRGATPVGGGPQTSHLGA